MTEVPGLDYITPPQEPVERIVGTSKSGKVKILVYGGLTTEEEGTIAQLLLSQRSAYVRAAELAELISSKEKVKFLNETTNKEEYREISISEAYSVIVGVISGSEVDANTEEIRLRYAKEIEEIGMYFNLSATRQKEAAVTALIRSRLGKKEWTLEKTKALPSDLTNGIYAIFQEERSGEEKANITPSDEELKKSSEEKTDKEETKELTGQKSTTT